MNFFRKYFKNTDVIKCKKAEEDNHLNEHTSLDETMTKRLEEIKKRFNNKV
ncbi:hypothetical protein [Sulfurimonas sp.]|uniref:hypothetical protein n=1 Tax=Sulfurimonas sp. TaxID=2022749 RepID=UPI0026214CDB|nr:hypothetical protein [Sulfurimonas sp.]MDD5158175.1 hypothetical protein [Sulfurimonas sp.]